jgi:hypothetical protein
VTTTPSIPRLSATYPTARVRGRLIDRWQEQALGWVVLDAATAAEMGREQLGWFVGNHPPSTLWAAEQFGRLDANAEGGVWVVVPHSRELAYTLFAEWPHTHHVTEPPKSDNPVWRSRKVWVATPEYLRQLVPPARALPAGIAGVIVLDPLCILYKARGGTDSWGNRHYNDRPQHIVNFRAALNADGWQPPLLLLTTKPAKAVNTQNVARALCLAAFQFIAGDSFACWDVPIEQE